MDAKNTLHSKDVTMPDWTLEPWTHLLRILLAAALGGVIGIERDIHGRAAGLRTHILVSMGAAVFTILSTHLVTHSAPAPAGFTSVSDPARIAAQIVSGIGFLGAGAILKEGFTVRGLTTAASLWVAASIGMATGAGFFPIALLATALAVFSLSVLARLELPFNRVTYRSLVLTMPIDTDVGEIVDVVSKKHVKVVAVGLTRDYVAATTTARLSLRLGRQDGADELAGEVLDRLEQTGIPMVKAAWRNP